MRRLSFSSLTFVKAWHMGGVFSRFASALLMRGASWWLRTLAFGCSSPSRKTSPHHFSLFFTCERHPQTAATAMSFYRRLPFRNTVSSSSCAHLQHCPSFLTTLPLD